MASRETSIDVDFQELRARAESIDAGVRLTLVICAAGWLYVAATWDRPDRQLIASLFGLCAVAALLFVLIPHERVVRSRWRELMQHQDQRAETLLREGLELLPLLDRRSALCVEVTR